MPEQTWRNLPAGHEMDALIAERVLGWECHRIEKGPYAGLVVGWTKPEGGDGFPDKSPFSTDIAAAWLVVEAMEARGNHRYWVAREWWGTKGYGFTAAFWKQPADSNGPHTGYAEANADTAPLAICRAALAALEVGS